jgi:hypothetical protein
VIRIPTDPERMELLQAAASLVSVTASIGAVLVLFFGFHFWKKLPHREFVSEMVGDALIGLFESTTAPSRYTQLSTVPDSYSLPAQPRSPKP